MQRFNLGVYSGGADAPNYIIDDFGNLVRTQVYLAARQVYEDFSEYTHAKGDWY